MPASDIDLLEESARAVRLRPRMYFDGGFDAPGLGNRLVEEACCMSLSALRQGIATRLVVRLWGDAHVELTDDGPGVGVCMDHGRRWPTVLMTSLFACRDAKLSHDESLCKLGLASVNALSARASLETSTDGRTWRQTFAEGSATSELVDLGPCSATGLKLEFRLDTALMPNVLIDATRLRRWCAQQRARFSADVRFTAAEGAG